MFSDMASCGFCGVTTLVLAPWCRELDPMSAGLVVQGVSVLMSACWYVCLVLIRQIVELQWSWGW